MAKPRVQIVDRDLGFRDLVRRVEKASGSGRVVSVGIHAEDDEPTADGSSTILQVANYHEFGIGVPERSIVREWAEQKDKENEDILRKLAESVVQGRNSVEEGLEKAGLVMAASMRGRIQNGEVAPPLAEKTIERKGSSTPLIDHGFLVSSIAHKVE